MKLHTLLLALFIPALVPNPASAEPTTAAASADPADPPPADPSQIALVGKLPVELKARRTRVGLLLVRPQINGQDAGWFILDTGAGMSCIDAQLAQKLKLPEAGGVSARGSGGRNETKLRKYESLALGPVQIKDSTVVELNLSAIALAIGHPIDGIIGYECFLPAVYEIDFVGERVTIYDFKTYQLPPRATTQSPTQPATQPASPWQPITMYDRRPCTPASIEAHEPGLFLIDSGATGFVTVHGPAVKKLKLLEGRDTSVTGFGGVGGIRAARSGKLESFSIASRKLTGVPTVFSQADEGSLADETVQGIVGTQLLEQFRVIVDYPGKRLALLAKEK
jgi:hypothetical protein